MDNNFEYLRGLFSVLSLHFDLEKEEILNVLDNSLLRPHLHRVRQELERALSDQLFDWVNFALKNKYIYEGIKPLYANNDIIREIYSFVWDYLYPDKALTISELDMLSKIAVEMLQKEHKNDGWILQSEIGKELAQQYSKFNPINTFFLSDLAEQGVLLCRRNEGIDPNGFIRYNYSFKIPAGL